MDRKEMSTCLYTENLDMHLQLLFNRVLEIKTNAFYLLLLSLLLNDV